MEKEDLFNIGKRSKGIYKELGNGIFSQFASNIYIYSDDNSNTNKYFNEHIPGNYHKTIQYYSDDLKEGSQFFFTKLISKGFKTVVGGPQSIILSAVMFVNSFFDTQMPTNSDSISVQLFNEFNNLIYKNKNNSIGYNVSINNFALIQSTYDKSFCYENILQEYNCPKVKYSDGFIFENDQKAICQNVDSSNKYYIGFKNIPHFSSKISKFPFVQGGLDNHVEVLNVISFFLNNNEVEMNNDIYDIISHNQICED